MGALAAFLALNLDSGPLFQQAPPPGSAAATAPAEVVYAIFFKELAAFQKHAGELERRGKRDDYGHSHQQEVTELSDRQFAKVRAVAASCIQDVETYDRQAQELIDLAQKRKARILAGVEEIRNALGPGAFLYFDMLVRGHLAAHPGLLPPAAVPPASDGTGAPR
jgi:hypothetical protein